MQNNLLKSSLINDNLNDPAYQKIADKQRTPKPYQIPAQANIGY